MDDARDHPRSRKRRRLPARAASSLAAVTALVIAPLAVQAEEQAVSARSFQGGTVPLEFLRPPLGGTAGGYHQVRPGEHLSGIAAGYGLDDRDGWRRLFDANPQVLDPDHLEPRSLVRIPLASESFASRDLPRRALPASPQAAARATVTGSGGGSVWDRLAGCESGGNWQSNTGNGYYGGLQFSLRSWQAVGGAGYPHEHSRATQVAMAERLRAVQGWGAWPSCSRKLGLR